MLLYPRPSHPKSQVQDCSKHHHKRLHKQNTSIPYKSHETFEPQAQIIESSLFSEDTFSSCLVVRKISNDRALSPCLFLRKHFSQLRRSHDYNTDCSHSSSTAYAERDFQTIQPASNLQGNSACPSHPYRASK